MRIAAVIFSAALTLNPATASPSVEEVFRAFGLFGTWAVDCKQPARIANPRISITAPNAGTVLEDHDLGSGVARNRYSVLSAQRVSATRLSVAVTFQPGAGGEERQKLAFLIRNGTRRTMFNQPEGGPVRVLDGVALAQGVKTPVLRKCE